MVPNIQRHLAIHIKEKPALNDPTKLKQCVNECKMLGEELMYKEVQHSRRTFKMEEIEVEEGMNKDPLLDPTKRNDTGLFPKRAKLVCPKSKKLQAESNKNMLLRVWDDVDPNRQVLPKK